MIKIQDLNKGYKTKKGPLPVLKSLSLSVNTGDYLSIMGESGSGKSTFLNILGLLDRFDSGQFYFTSQDVSLLSDRELTWFRNKHIGFIFQHYNLLPRLTVFQNVYLPLMLRKEPVLNANEKVSHILEKLGLEKHDHHYPNELSGGQQQRVSIARALVHKPDVIIADEPTGNLDPNTEEVILSLFEQLHREGATLIVVTHSHKVSLRAVSRYRLDSGILIKDTLSKGE